MSPEWLEFWKTIFTNGGGILAAVAVVITAWAAARRDKVAAEKIEEVRKDTLAAAEKSRAEAEARAAKVAVKTDANQEDTSGKLGHITTLVNSQLSEAVARFAESQAHNRMLLDLLVALAPENPEVKKLVASLATPRPAAPGTEIGKEIEKEKEKENGRHEAEP